MKSRKQEIIGVLLCVVALFVFLSFVTHDPGEWVGGLSEDVPDNNYMGIAGIYVSHYLMRLTFGWGTLFFPLIMGIAGYTMFTHRDWEPSLRLSAYLTGLGIWSSIIIAWIGQLMIGFKIIPSEGSYWETEYSGIIGFFIWHFLSDIFGSFSLIILFVIAIILISGIFNFSIYDSLKSIWQKLKNGWLTWQEKRRMDHVIIHNKDEDVQKPQETLETEKDTDSEKFEDIDSALFPDEEIVEAVAIEEPDEIQQPTMHDNEDSEEQFVANNIPENEIDIEEEKDVAEGDLDAEKERRARYRQYKLPTLEYLNDPIEIKNPQTEESLKEKANQLIHALETFGVSGRVVRISPGPVITLFEIEPAEGVRVNKFTNLSDDLARVMRAQRVRIIAPIPGSKSVGVELPNDNPATVYLKNIINSEQYIQSKSKLTISLGKTTTGDAFVFDLEKMPHLLVAGATGSGKSVCINTMILSILYKAKPDEVKFILMDPKKVELTTYKSLVGYHLITANNLDEYVMTTAENAVGILDSAIVEMERRFQIFSDTRVRNIGEYHERRLENEELESIPYIVVVIDELADLMLTSGRAIEDPITRLAQKARAVGIHLVVATQRPSVDVITGLIKANFPARIAFHVSSRVDSRTIIDQMGAEKLLGRGDMLFLLPGTASPIRLHNAYVTLDEIEAIMEHIEIQPKPEEILLPEITKDKVGKNFNLDEGQDELLHDAAMLVTQNQQASVSLLQRKFRIGYSRAGRLIDELESLGIVSGYSGSKAREVLVSESYLENIFNE